MAKKTMFELGVEIIPTHGGAVMKVVSVPASATVAEVAEAAGIKDVDKKNILVNGKKADRDTRVTSTSKVSISERPRGS